MASGRHPSPICQAAAVSGGSLSGGLFDSTVPMAKPNAPASARMMPGSLAALAAKPWPPMMAASPRTPSRAPRAPHGRPLAENRPGQQRSPDRHGVGEQRRLAGRQPQQREGDQHHPAHDVEDRRQHQPRPQPRGTCRLCRGSAPAPPAKRPEHAGEAAQGQRRQFAQQVFGDRPVEAPAQRGDGEKKQPRGRDARSRAAGFDSVMEESAGRIEQEFGDPGAPFSAATGRADMAAGASP